VSVLPVCVGLLVCLSVAGCGGLVCLSVGLPLCEGMHVYVHVFVCVCVCVCVCVLVSVHVLVYVSVSACLARVYQKSRRFAFTCSSSAGSSVEG
jgi:hypothetical protein